MRFYTEEQAAALSENMPAALKQDLTGKHGLITEHYPSSASAFEREIYIGLGKAEEVKLSKLKSAASLAVSQASSLKLKSVTLEVPKLKSISVESASSAIASAIVKSCYRFDRYITDENRKSAPVDDVALQVPE